MIFLSFYTQNTRENDVLWKNEKRKVKNENDVTHDNFDDFLAYSGILLTVNKIFY